MNELVTKIEGAKGRVVTRMRGAFSLSYPDVVLTSRLWWRLALKRMFDLIVSLALLVLFAPVMLLAALAIKLDSRGPLLYSQKRVGRSGRGFRIYKFRTMIHNAEAQSGPVWAGGRDDPRLTRVGRFLRRTHLDELPQLFNVLRSEMSLVGPRPERTCFMRMLKKEVHRYNERLLVKPGITGLAQVHYRYDRTVADVKRKIRFDLLYIRRMCLALDLQILAWTFLIVITGKELQ